jgi:hypothetical protein
VADCREYFWAGADAVSLGSATWLASYPGYALSPVRALRARRVLAAVRRMSPPDRGCLPTDPAPDEASEHARHTARPATADVAQPAADGAVNHRGAAAR